MWIILALVSIFSYWFVDVELGYTLLLFVIVPPSECSAIIITGDRTERNTCDLGHQEKHPNFVFEGNSCSWNCTSTIQHPETPKFSKKCRDCPLWVLRLLQTWLLWFSKDLIIYIDLWVCKVMVSKLQKYTLKWGMLPTWLLENQLECVHYMKRRKLHFTDSYDTNWHPYLSKFL